MTAGEKELVSSVFGSAVNCDPVRIRRRRWFPLQPRDVTMAPMGHLHFPAGSTVYCDDFAQSDLFRQGLFIHEMTHVWQSQKKGRWFLPLMRHPFCRYNYTLRPGWPLERYGIEQQAEIVRHAFMLRSGGKIAGVAGAAAYDLLVDFPAPA